MKTQIAQLFFHNFLSSTDQLLTNAYITVGDSTMYSSNTRCRDPLESTEVNIPGGVVSAYCDQQVCGRYLAVISADHDVSMCNVDIYGFQNFPHKRKYN